MAEKINNQSGGRGELSPLHRLLLSKKEAEASGEKDPSDYQYVIYVRKSTDAKDKQQESLDDQLTDCRQLSLDLDLKVAKVYTESVSAREPGIRPVFREMMSALIAGKYDGLIAWSPDRLARNMREGGEIIDLLDQGIIKDLRFRSMTFVNNPDGRMLLGISFVMAKQWVDHHANRMKSSIDKRTQEGINLGKTKHGYFKDNLGRMRPDGENWTLIRGVFERRIAGMGLKEIAEWLERQSYPLKTLHGTKERRVIDAAFISALTRDPVYAGFLRYGGEIVSLQDWYDFVPMVSEEEYLQASGYRSLSEGERKRRVRGRGHSSNSNLLRKMVICADCEEPMTTSVATKISKTHGRTGYFYYRCDTPTCPSIGKHTRAKVIIAAAVDWLRNNPLPSVEGHKHYVEEMTRLAEDEKKALTNQGRSLEQKKNHANERLERVKKIIEETPEADVRALYTPEVKKIKADVREIEEAIRKTNEEKDALPDAILAFDDFVKKSQKLAERLGKEKEMVKLDWIIKKIFSNFLVKDGKVVKVQTNSPFTELVAIKKNHPEDDSSLVTSPGIEPGFKA